jgi:DNA-binding transcriptional LysR family regulator
MARLDIRDLRIFATVARCLNFTRAAAQLHMAQPPLSRAIRKLESVLGVVLFERSTHHVALTKAGQALLPRAMRILRDVADVETMLKAHATTPRAMRIGLTTSVEPGTFARFSEALNKHASIETTYAPSPRLCTLLVSGRLDAAVIALPTNTIDLTVVSLGSQPMIVALPTKHRLAKRRRLSLAELRSEKVFWFERARQPAFYDHCQAIFAMHDFAPAMLKEPADHHVLLASVASGRGMAFLPRSFSALKLAGVSYRPLVEGDELQVRLAFVHAGELGVAQRKALQAAKRTIGTAT